MAKAKHVRATAEMDLAAARKAIAEADKRNQEDAMKEIQEILKKRGLTIKAIAQVVIAPN